MDAGMSEVPAQDVGVGSSAPQAGSSSIPTTGNPPNLRAMLAVGVAIAALLGVYALGRASEPTPRATPVIPTPTATAVPATPAPTSTPEPEPPPELVDLLGEGSVLAELQLGTRSRAILWCRESVPGTQISSTLALVHLATSIQFGDQVVLYEELTKPWIPGGSFRRGFILDTEGLGGGNFAVPAPAEEVAEPLESSDGTRCQSCAPDRVTIGSGDVLVGSCVHGVPLGVGIVYVIAPPVRPGQTPLALHVSCGITGVHIEGDQILIDGEAPLVRGLHEARFPLPTVSFSRSAGSFVADDLGLLDWNCDIERSSHLEGRHLLRSEPTRSISFERTASAIGEIGVHGPMVLGLSQDQCSLLTRAWWGQEDIEQPTGTPISDLVGLAPPAGQRDWFYSCFRQPS